MVQRDLEEHDLNSDHDEGLDEQGGVILGSGIIEYPVESRALAGVASRNPGLGIGAQLT